MPRPEPAAPSGTFTCHLCPGSPTWLVCLGPTQEAWMAHYRLLHHVTEIPPTPGMKAAWQACLDYCAPVVPDTVPEPESRQEAFA